MDKCKFCNSESDENINHKNETRKIKCPKCGVYWITFEGYEDFHSGQVSEENRILFSGYIRNNSSERNPIIITTKELSQISDIVSSYRRLSVLEKVYMVIRFLGDSSNYLGQVISLVINKDYTRFFCTKPTELKQIKRYLDERGFIRIIRGGEEKVVLTVAGWEEYERLKEINIHSKKVFVAMNFDKKFDEVFRDAIVPACKECGFYAERIDFKEHNENICDVIIGGIKESRFLIADFTGQKHGVYFEAGFAQGLNLAVIWTCKESDKENIHFDTRQYNHIFWKDAKDLRKRLVYRIKATIAQSK